MSLATCFSWLPIPVVGNVAVTVGSGWFRVVSALSAWLVVSLALLIRVALVSNPSNCREALPLVKGLAAVGPFQFRFKTLARVPVPIASCRLVTPVKYRLVPATDTLIGRGLTPFKPPVTSDTRPPQPVWPVRLQIEVIC